MRFIYYCTVLDSQIYQGRPLSLFLQICNELRLKRVVHCTDLREPVNAYFYFFLINFNLAKRRLPTCIK
jgi:hypothetical protein